MHKLKYVLLIFVMIIISLLPAALTTPPDTTQYNFDLSTNIPASHKIKIINYGNGSILINGELKKNGDIVMCPRFSNLDIEITPNKNYEIDTITFNNDDLTSSLNSNLIILHNITKDGTLKFKFKATPKIIEPSSLKNTLLETKDLLTEKALKTLDFVSNGLKTGDLSILSIFIIFILIMSPLIYIVDYIKRKLN